MSWDGKDRRRFPRAPILCNIIVYSPYKIFNSYTEDIGEGGTRIVLKEGLPLRTMVSLKIIFDKDTITRCKGRVAWTTKKMNVVKKQHYQDDKQPACLFSTGIEFTQIDSQEKQHIRELVDIILNQSQKN